nr:MAG TPA: BppU domain protein [Bacteriophage sp.]
METIYKTFDVALELKQTSTNAPFYVIEGDNGNKIRITVTDGGSAVDLTDCRVIAVFSKSNGTSMQDSAEAGGGVTIGGTYNNEVTVALRPASIAPGQVECELQIYSDENKTTLITTAKFNFECQRAIFNENTAMATNEYPLLVSLISVCNGIVAAEELRVTAEASRVSAEGERAAAEAARETAEGERVEAEEAREAAETARVSAESTRVVAEQGRETAEQSRVTAETARASAETERKTAENERKTAETARTSAEASRVTAEQGRVSAENTRVSQEQERQAEILKIAGMTVEVTTLAAGAQATAELVESGDHKVLKLGIPKGQDGSGTGDMSKSTYDKDNNGVVDKADDADKLGGKAASEYQPAGTYAAPDDVSGAVSGHNSASNAHSALFSKKQTAPALASSLPASGAALTANTIYNVSSPVGTYVFTPPASGWAHGTFSTAASVAVSFVSGANYLGEAPAIEASKTYEFDVYNGVWAVQEVVSA